MDKKKLKIAVVHDHLGFSGGGERTVLLMALRLGADFITAYSEPTVFLDYQRKLGKRLKILSQRVIYMRVVRFFWLRFLFWKKRRIFQDYDILIASSQTATEVVAHYSRKDAARIVYTHTTPRRVFDLYEISKNMYPFILRGAYALFARYWKRRYLRAIRKFNVNIANSENVRKRIKEHTKGDASAVVWPPIMTSKYRFIESGDYFLSFGRLDEAKRIEMIVEAFQRMGEKKLVVASGGPRLDTVKKMAEGYDNIVVKGWVSDEELVELVGKCRASIYIPIDEDAGMTHLETNAAGKPYIGVREGGLVESTIDGKTGVLIKKDPLVGDLMEAVEKMNKEWCEGKKEACVEHAQKYNEESFYEKIEKLLTYSNPSVPVLGVDASRWEDPRHPGKHVRSGVETVAKNLLEQIVKQAGKHKLNLRIYTPRTIQALPLHWQKVIPLQKGWTRNALAKELEHSPVDYFFTPAYYIPQNAPEKSFAIVHDVLFRSNPEKYSWRDRLGQKLAIKENFKRAKKIFTPSDFSRQEILKYYEIADNKIIAFPMGYSRITNYELRIMNEREKYILFLGRVNKKKSIDVLVKAFAGFSKNNPDWKLKLAGSLEFGSDDLKGLVRAFDIEDKVEFLGYVSDEEKWDLLSRASLLVHPSVHEGSAIPILEAFDVGTPVVAADAPAIQEVGEDAVVYFKSGEPESLKNRIEALLADKDLQATNIQQGKKYLEARSWERVADEILKAIKK